MLKQGGFGFKYVVYSGREPGEKASPDGVHIKLLGYKWNSRNDILYPGFAELNLNKKVRGAKSFFTHLLVFHLARSLKCKNVEE